MNNKIMKSVYRMCLNAGMRQLVSPKSALMVFNELFKNVPINVQEHRLNGIMSYTATIEIDGLAYTANHISKVQAKQKACENVLRVMMANKICERSEKHKGSPIMEIKMGNGENGTVLKPKNPIHDDFPWSHFASLGMHTLINQWELHPLSKAISLQEQLNVIKSPPTASSVKKFPKNQKTRNPVKRASKRKINQNAQGSIKKSNKKEFTF